MLTRLAAQPGAPAGFRAAALRNVVSQEDNVEAVVNRVALDEVDAGIVYVSDLKTPNGSQVMQVPVPDSANVTNDYPVAVVSASPNQSIAHAFIAFLLGSEGQSVLRRSGFLPPG
jgi:molybdate transport system substrate-binding protein